MNAKHYTCRHCGEPATPQADQPEAVGSVCEACEKISIFDRAAYDATAEIMAASRELIEAATKNPNATDKEVAAVHNDIADRYGWHIAMEAIAALNRALARKS